jgi:hypothetical protein
MEITGKVIKLLPLVTGQGRNGEWKKQEFILETPGQYPKQVCCSIWGEKIDEAQLKENEEIKANIDIQSREHNGRWYTEVRAWKIERPSSQVREGGNDFIDVTPDDEGDDLPF